MNAFQLVLTLLSIFAATGCGKTGDDDNVVTGVADPDAANDSVSGAWRGTLPDDVTAPPQLVSFSVSAGPWLGQTTLVVGYPDEIGDYAKIDFRRSKGTTAPADCATGTLAVTAETSRKTVSSMKDFIREKNIVIAPVFTMRPGMSRQ